MTNTTANVPRELPTAYELATYEGRKLDDSRSDGYCGSCPIETHIAQLKDPKSWVHSCIKLWENLGGLRSESAPSPAGVGGLETICVTQGGCNVSWTATKVLSPAGTALCRLSDAQAIVDGLRGEVARLDAGWRAENVSALVQAQRISELEGLLREAVEEIRDLSVAADKFADRIDAALTAGKKGE